MLEGHTVLPATHTFLHEYNKPVRLYSVSIHQMALPERGSAPHIRLQFSTHLSTTKG